MVTIGWHLWFLIANVLRDRRVRTRIQLETLQVPGHSPFRILPRGQIPYRLRLS